RARLEVLLRALALREEAGGLDHDVDAEIAPGQARGIALGQDLELAPGDGDAPLARTDVLAEGAQDRVVLEQMRHRLRVTKIVRGDDLEVIPTLEVRPKKVPPDPPEPVDPNPSSHQPSPSLLLRV